MLATDVALLVFSAEEENDPFEDSFKRRWSLYPWFYLLLCFCCRGMLNKESLRWRRNDQREQHLWSDHGHSGGGRSLQNWPHRWQEQMSTGMLSHVTDQSVCENEYNIGCPQDILRWKLVFVILLYSTNMNLFLSLLAIGCGF
jgi:hypothetical protein